MNSYNNKTKRFIIPVLAGLALTAFLLYDQRGTFGTPETAHCIAHRSHRSCHCRGCCENRKTIMTSYLPYVFGISSLVLGIALFLRAFKIYRPKTQTEAQADKAAAWDKKFGMLMKIVSVVLILKGCYNIFSPNRDQYKINSTVENNGWTKEARGILIKNCLRDARPVAVEHPEIMKDYCACSVDNIMKGFTQKKYEESLAKPQSEQLKEQLPLFQDCLDASKRRIDSVRSSRR